MCTVLAIFPLVGEAAKIPFSVLTATGSHRRLKHLGGQQVRTALRQQSAAGVGFRLLSLSMIPSMGFTDLSFAVLFYMYIALSMVCVCELVCE